MSQKSLASPTRGLYKHFKDKEDLFETLVADWLERTEAKALAYSIADVEDRVQAMHDWLSLLADYF